ncbi:MAG: RNA polymerase sigma factor RpoE [Pseudomonadota bacterium]
MGENNNDKELVERAKAGDTRAFDLLVKKYQYKVVNLVSRYVRSDEAQDVAQEAFIKAYRGLKNFRGDSAFYTWMYRIAVNSAKNYLLSASRKQMDHQVDVDDAEYFDDAALLRDHSSPDHVLQSAELEEKVFDAIQSLPDDLKMAITLRELEGMSYEQIADAMECPIGTVRSRIFRAREAIDKVIKPLMD